MKESKSVCIKFHYEKYNKELEIGYNEENRFHAIIKTNEIGRASCRERVSSPV